MSVDLCGVTFSGTHEPVDGLIYSRLIGWDGRTSARGGGDSIPGWQGEYPRSEELRESRVITVEAAIVSDSVAEYMAVKRRVENIPMFGEMRVDQGDGVWTRAIEIAAIDIPDARGATETEFTIDMIAPDPVRYRDPVMLGPVGLPVRSGGLRLPKRFPWNFGTSILPVLTIVNGGSRPTFPIVTVTGSGSSLTVSCGPRRMEFGAWSGEFVIDNRERRAFLNGADVTRQLIRREWQEIPAGASWDLTYDVADADPSTQMFATYQEGAW